MVVIDSIAALKLYEQIFDIDPNRNEVSDFGIGFSEVVFNIYDGRFHLLDENPNNLLTARQPTDPYTSWTNVAVPDIATTYAKALAAGCLEIAPINDAPALGIKSAIFVDPFGYMWMLHQVDRVVSHEERMEIFKKSLHQ